MSVALLIRPQIINFFEIEVDFRTRRLSIGNQFAQTIFPVPSFRSGVISSRKITN